MPTTGRRLLIIGTTGCVEVRELLVYIQSFSEILFTWTLTAQEIGSVVAGTEFL